MWFPAVFGEMTSRAAISLFDSPCASSRSTSTSRGVSPAGPSRRRWTRCPAAARTASTASASSRPDFASARSAAAASSAESLRAVRARLAHRLVRVRRAEDPRRPRDRVAGQPARIAGAVEALAVLHRDGAERRERIRPVQHALGQIRVRAHALPFAGSERAALVPDRVRHAEPPEVVHEPGASKRPHLVVGQIELRRRRCDEIGDRARMAARVRGLQVDEVGDRLQAPRRTGRRRARPQAPAPPRSPRPRC